MKKVLVLLFPTSQHAARAFKRVQEFYENPELQGQICLSDDRIDEWNERVNPGRKYEDIYIGFNLPVDSTRLFFQWVLPASPEERFLWSLYEQAEADYIIGCARKDTVTLAHELAHAFWHCDSDYREAAEEALARLNPHARFALRVDLHSLGYSEQVMDDEMNAYLATGLTDDFEESQKYKTVKTVSKILRKLFNKTRSDHERNAITFGADEDRRNVTITRAVYCETWETNKGTAEGT